MTTFIPTTTVSIYRGEGVDSFGDPVDVPTEVAAGLPAAVAEISQRWFRPAEQRGGMVETFLIRLRPTAQIEEGDRLVDDRHNDVVYLVQEVVNPQSLIGMADVRVTAQRVGALSQPVNG